MTHPQVLSDEQIFKDWCKAKEESPRLSQQVLSFARAIESATLDALSGQAVAWAVEYGAVSLPHGDPSRITEWQVHATKEAAEASAKAMDFDSRIHPIPTNPPAQQEPFGYFKATPFGWTDCAETDEGAVALYERP
jgi:hypothetical protein